jgi:putative transposase
MLNLKKKIWIVKQKEIGKLTDSEIASVQKVTRMTVHRLWVKYNQYGEDALKDKQLGRPKQDIPNDIKNLVIKKKKETGFGVRKIEGILNLEGIYIPHNKIHEILTEVGLVEHNPKKGKRYNYIRWERKHSNSLWQTDFCWIEKLECWLCAWLDDHSRFITAMDYMTEATTNNVIELFEKAADKYGYPRETISDRGAQFYAMRGGTSRFLEHIESKGVKHIYASIKKPTTCGKIERFWGTHNRERWNFSTLKDFMNYYNHKRPHMSLNYYTPYAVYMKDFKV